VFWLLDAVAALYLGWWITETLGRRSLRTAYAAVVLLALASTARGAYLLETGDRHFVSLDLPSSDWTDAMRWLAARPERWLVIADPNHVYTEGPSVRIAALQDVLLDASKDPALAIYDRSAAMRVADREAALQHFDTLSAAAMKQIAVRYDADVLVDRLDRPRDLPVLFSNHGFVVYRVK
jgi:hypothetical protein